MAPLLSIMRVTAFKKLQFQNCQKKSQCSLIKHTSAEDASTFLRRTNGSIIKRKSGHNVQALANQIESNLLL
jgi:hypothetical protein